MLALILRARLASFDNAYRCAVRLREHTGHPLYIIRTGDPIQPICISAVRPEEDTRTLAMVS